MNSQRVDHPDIILIGSGIMSANLGALLKRLRPEASIQLYETTEELAQESSNGWNNAGTGHAGICELSYTPHREKDGSVNVAKAIEIFEQFERSKQFWAYAVQNGMIDTPADFIRPVPHLSFVVGQEQVDYLRARYDGLKAHHFFRTMEFSTDPQTIAQWAPLLVEGREPGPIAATKMENGTDVNFGNVARKLLEWLGRQDRCAVSPGHRVLDLQRCGEGWEVSVQNVTTGVVHQNRAKFVFIGAGGGSLRLLQKSGIPESKGLGGFPVGGQWLICENEEVIARHQAKVYGQALGAAPTMAVPHLDTRLLNGKKTLLFGPFAAWTTKFLHKTGCWTDLPGSVRPDNIATLLKVGIHNLDLVRYLVEQGLQSKEDRLASLHEFYPAAKSEDWRVIEAGIRVQAIKKTDGEAGIVHYGTEVITSADRTLSTLLGASPGASVSVHIVLEVIETCFPQWLASPEGRARLHEMIPACVEDAKLAAHAARFEETTRKVDETLGLC